jgi:nucleotide-binding universal stress UspA family protein
MTVEDSQAGRPPVVIAASALDERSDEVVAAAWRIAARQGAELRLLHASPLPHLVPGMPVQPSHSLETLAARATQELEAQARRLRPAGAPPARLQVEPGPADAVLASAARECGAGLIVVGATTTHGRLGKLLGSTAERLLQIAPVPVLVVRDELPVPPRTVLAPVDLSLLSYDALASGVALLSRWAGSGSPAVRCELLCIVAPGEGDGPVLAAALQQAQTGVESVAAQLESPALRFAPRVLAGEPRDQILRTLEELDCDLLLMGTRGSGGLQHRLGVVATDVAREAPCSVLLIPPDRAFGDQLAASVHEALAPAGAGRRRTIPGGER